MAWLRYCVYCGQLSTSNDTVSLSIVSNVADDLLDTRQLYGGDIDVSTDVMDVVVKRVDTVAMDANSSATVHKLFEASNIQRN